MVCDQLYCKKLYSPGLLLSLIHICYVKDTVTYENGTLVTGTSIPNGAVIVVTYKVDDNQKKTLSYTVQHKVNGTVRDTFTEETTVQVCLLYTARCV